MYSQTPHYRRPRASRWPCLCLTLALVLAPFAGPGQARAAGPGPTCAAACQPAPLALLNGILGNRTRMIQIATLGMAIAIFILTRGHSKY
jgi:hypothetical protein